MNASRRLRSRLKRCDTSSLSAPALLLLPVTPGLHRLSRQLNQRQQIRSPILLRVGEIEGAPTRHEATPEVPRTPAQDQLGSGASEVLLISQAERGGARISLSPDHLTGSWQFSSSFLQGRYCPSAQSFPENAGPYGSGFAGTSVESASHATHPVLAEAEGSIRVKLTQACVSALARWRHPFWLKQGMILDTLHRKKVVMTDVSNKGWAALCEVKPTFGLWSEKESGLHINCLEMLAVCQACQFFLPDINQQGGLVSKILCTLPSDLLVWAQNNLRSLKATLVLRKMNQGADMLSKNNVSSEERTLHPLTVQRIWEVLAELE